MHPVRVKGPQQLRREERMREAKVEAENLLVRLVDGERIFRLPRELRLELAWLSLSPEWASRLQLRSLPTRTTALAALQVRNYTSPELDRFVTAAGLGAGVLRAVLLQRAVTNEQRLKAIHERCFMTHGDLAHELVPGIRTDLWTTACALVCQALPTLDEYRQRFVVQRLVSGGWPALETFEVLLADAHRSRGVASQDVRLVDALVDQSLLVLA